MIGGQRIGFDPSLPVGILILLALAAAAGLGVYIWRRGGAPILRTLGLLFLFIGLMQPQWVRETRQAAQDVALVIVDQSESLGLAGRRDAARAAADEMVAQISRDPSIDVRVRETRGGPDGTLIATLITDAIGDVPRERIAGVVMVTDGQAADAPDDPQRFADLGPAHVLIVGDPDRGDRRLELLSAPTFGIVGEQMHISARVHDPGNGEATVSVSIDGERAGSQRVRLNRPFDIRVRTPHRGRNMVIVEVERGSQEITLSNNRAAFPANGVRDRLRVLLITGEPHQGARVWRNLLKSDPSVDLVHFTILRSPDKFDSTPLNELALIPFPTEELFERRLDEFDLIIFDRYRQLGILQAFYYGNIARRVQEGGALLISSGPAEAGGEGLNLTQLQSILPSSPTGRVLNQPFRPAMTALGQRHPVVRGLPAPERWGRWTRQVDARATRGQTVLSGIGGAPLLVLDRAGRGRVAQLWSDQSWLWARGYEGGGPHGELLRRLGHWLMQEPELEDERLTLDPGPRGLAVTRATLNETAEQVQIIAPSGARSTLDLDSTTPGLWRGQAQATEQGLYEARAGNLRAFAAVGPLNPREAAAGNADPDILRPLAQPSGGGVILTGEDGRNLPDVRRVGRSERAFGDDWIGLERNEAYVVRAAVATPLGPGWVWALMGAALLMLGWRREAR